MLLFESKIQSLSRKELLIILGVFILPLLGFGRIFPPLLVFPILSAIIFPIGYWWGFWSNKRVRLLAEGSAYKLELFKSQNVLESYPGLKITGYGWVYDDFSSAITKEEEEVDIPADGPRRGVQTTNTMLVIQFKSDNTTLYLLESLSPWRSTPNYLPYFYQKQLDKENCYFHVKRLEPLMKTLFQ